MFESFELTCDEHPVRKAFELFDKGEHEAAERLCKQLLNKTPNDFNAKHLLGVISLIHNRFDEAITQLESALKTNQLDPSCHNNLGEAYRSVGRYDDAEAHYREAIALDETYMTAYCNLGLLLGLMGRYEESEAALERSLQRNPNQPVVLNNLGLVRMRAGKLSAAEDVFRQAISCNPDNPEFHINLINCQTAGGNPDEAEQSCRAALVLHHNLEIFHNRLGLLLKDCGRYEEALQAFESALRINPRYSVAYTNLGALLHSLGRLADAEAAFRTSIMIQPESVEAYCNLGVVLKEQGSLQEAEEAILHALSLDSNSAEAHNHLAGVFHAKGQCHKAEDSYRQSLALKPDYLEAMSNLAALLVSNNRHEEAAELLSEIVRQQPSNVMAGHVLMALRGESPDRAPGDYVSALFDGYAHTFDSHLVTSLGYCTPENLYNLIKPHITDKTELDILDLGCGTGLIGELVCHHARNLVGVDLSAKMLEKARDKSIYGRLVESDLLAMMKDEPAQSYDLIIAADVFIYLGALDDIVLEAKRILRPGGLLAFSVESLDALESTSRKDELPDFKLMPTARYCHSGRYIAELAAKTQLTVERTEMIDGRFESGHAVKFSLMLMRRERDPDSTRDTARIARDRRDWDTAITAYTSQLQADPADLEALSGVGACLQMQNRHEDAIAWYDTALRCRPDDPVLHCNRALALLTVGRYAEGWQELQWRRRLISELLPPLPFLTPDQLPALSGKRVLLHAEQGFGDTIQMLRYLSLLERHGAEIVLTVPQPLVRLVMAQPSVRQVIPHGELLPAADCQALLQDLPYLFGTTPMSIPSDIPYLVVPEALRAAWKERTAVHSGVKVGLAWACGGTDQRNRKLRSLQFHDVVPLLALSGVEFYSLQIGDAALTEQQRQAYANLHDPTPSIRDFADTAALVMALDQVITVDTAVAHLAGALGKPVTLLLPSFREWRWVERQGHPIWYPTVTIVAIPENGWNDASGSIADACAGLLPTRADTSPSEIGCRLCGGYVVPILRASREFFICSECGLIFSECLLSLKEAEQHYQSQHEVEFDFEEYAGKILALVTPRVVLKRILDFGAGSGKLSETLRGMGFSVDSYEPMNDGDFHEECYPPGYDLIIINEVIEHCADIGKIFDLLNRLCAPGGIVYVGTLTTDGLIDDPATFRDRFAGWWYKDDPTHISFLCLKTFEYICKQPASRFHMIGYGPSGALLQKAPL